MTQEITTERLVLRPFVAADGPEVVRLLNDYSVSKWLARVPHPFGIEDLRLVDEADRSRWPDLAAICHEGSVIGAVSPRAEHLGYWIGSDFWRRGFGSEAVSAAVRFVFQTGARRIMSSVFEGNIASHRILKRLGFEETGRSLAPCLARGEDIPNVDYCLHAPESERR